MLGLFDWITGKKKPSKTGKEKRDSVNEVQESFRGSEKKDTLVQQLKVERDRSREKDQRIKEMENRFNDLQSKWASMLEKQQETMSEMIETKNSEITSLEPEIRKKEEKKSPGTYPDEKFVEGKGEQVEMYRLFSSPIKEDKSFENFVVDDSNRFPYLAAEAVALDEGRKYNPLFIYGPVGVGKTHLLHAIANTIRDKNDRAELLYSSTERFTEVLIKALREDDIGSFREMYRNIDVLLVDDIQMLSGREATQKEFFHMFNHLYNSGKQIVLCSDRPPGDIEELETRLRSRFEGGLIIDIQVPTFEGRRQILVNLAQKDGFSISTEVLDYLAFYLDSSVRELEGGFNRVTAYASLMKEPITVSLVRKVLERLIQKREFSRKEKELSMEGVTVSTDDDKRSQGTSGGGPYEELDLEEETEMIEKELLFELRKDTDEE